MKEMNAWNEIPLSDYELHMGHETVGQLKLLNRLTHNYLEMLKPPTAAFLGIAGGNGLEHIDNAITQKVVGIDVNAEYLSITKERYAAKIPSLQLLHVDLSQEAAVLFQADFIWAALILEYAGTANVLNFSHKNVKPNGHLVVSVQLNNNAPNVSETGIESVKKAGKIFKPVNVDELDEMAALYGFLQLSNEENILPNGKTIKTCLFQKI
jgi:SAM-dependent methyltransferases